MSDNNRESIPIAQEDPEFLRVRDDFFINPKEPTLHHLAAATAAFLSHSHQNGHGHEAADVKDPLARQPAIVEVAKRLAEEFRGARLFDHLSVSQLHPADSMLGEIAHFASGRYNNNTIIGEVSPVETRFEQEAVSWLIEHIAGFDSSKASGSIVTGGTSANITALLVARERLEDRGWDGSQPAKLFVSPMAHYSIAKAAHMLAPHELIQIENVPLKHGEFTMDVVALRDMIRDAQHRKEHILGVVALAGETETGLVDDLADIAELVAENDLFLHIDGAYGAPFKLSRQGHLFDAMSGADSLTCDAHKYLYVPYACGSILFANSEEHQRLVQINEKGKAYMFKEYKDEDAPEVYSVYLGNTRIEGSMGGQAATALHATLTHFGKTGLRGLLNHNLDMAELFKDQVLDAGIGLKLSHRTELNTVCLEPDTAPSKEIDRRVEHVSTMLEQHYGIYLSTTSLPVQNGDARVRRKVFRFVSTHPYTDANDINYVVESLTKEWRNQND